MGIQVTTTSTKLLSGRVDTEREIMSQGERVHVEDGRLKLPGFDRQAALHDDCTAHSNMIKSQIRVALINVFGSFEKARGSQGYSKYCS